MRSVEVDGKSVFVRDGSGKFESVSSGDVLGFPVVVIVGILTLDVDVLSSLECFQTLPYRICFLLGTVVVSDGESGLIVELSVEGEPVDDGSPL